MAVRILLVCLVLCAAAPAGPRKEEKDPKKDPKWLEKVHTSIDRGVAWLLAKQSTSGTFPAFEDSRGAIYELGMHALATLTVIKGGQPLDSVEVRKALRSLDALYKIHRNSIYTYEAGLVLMVLDAKYFTTPPRKKKTARKKKKPRIDEFDLKMATEISTWLQTKQKPAGLWRYPQGGKDMSNTQYAALGLWSAHRLGVKIHKGVVRRLLDGTLQRQQKDGKDVPYIPDPRLVAKRKTDERRSGTTIKARGWRYMPKETITTEDGKRIERVYPYSGSMTTAGIAILAIGRDILGEDDSWLKGSQDRILRQSMWEGLAWLQDNWDLYDNPGQKGNWPFYWIYGLERAAQVSGVEFVGRHDWYVEGCNRLMADQKPDGSWPVNQRMKPPGGQNIRWWSDQVDTCFAILFLAKATPTIKTQAPTITVTGD
ncbi:MAG: hypothetical protein ACYSX0_07090 [Planctomycetota bacterium]